MAPALPMLPSCIHAIHLTIHDIGAWSIEVLRMRVSRYLLLAVPANKLMGCIFKLCGL
jgi:hypothetical protein